MNVAASEERESNLEHCLLQVGFALVRNPWNAPPVVQIIDIR